MKYTIEPISPAEKSTTSLTVAHRGLLNSEINFVGH